MCIYHVLKLVRTSSLTRLVDLVDDQRNSVGLFTEGQDLLKNQRVRTVSLTVTLMRSIHLLKRVDNDEHLLVRICIHHLLTAREDIINLRGVTTSEVTSQTQAVDSLLDLEERLFCSVEDTHCILTLSDSRSNSQNHSGLTSSRLTGEEGYRRRGESLTAHRRVNEVNTGGAGTIEMFWNFDSRDWGTEDEIRKFGCNSHVRLLWFLGSCPGLCWL